MRILMVLVFVMFMVSCEKTDCDKAKENYDKALNRVSIAETTYNSAAADVNAICSIVAPKDRSFDVSKACEIAKKGEQAAAIVLAAAKSSLVIWKNQLDASCPKE